MMSPNSMEPHVPGTVDEAKRFLHQNSKPKQVLAEFHPSLVTLSASHGPAESRVLSRIRDRKSRCSTETVLRATLFPARCQTSGVLAPRADPTQARLLGLHAVFEEIQ
ncbi:unnamed protein product [Rangifer tarandus platyrhynchus]|uniref:Uncharacterized protein n=1 Tax=Rangifer tarandus platyrhynchus TaxID=3082113 RepID=A0ABN8Y6F7_RANTA|nr:unnamed protein product [Rangifer tarandus platyrhynchus]